MCEMLLAYRKPDGIDFFGHWEFCIFRAAFCGNGAQAASLECRPRLVHVIVAHVEWSHAFNRAP
jgi:hypothetical protein